MPSHVRDWMKGLKEGGSERSAGPKADDLTPADRASLVRAAFEAVAAVGFATWKAKEREAIQRSGETDEQLWAVYLGEFEKLAWADFQAMSAECPSDRLYRVLEEYTGLADAMGLQEWARDQAELKAGRGWGR